MLEAREPTRLRYTWIDSDQGTPTVVSWALEPLGSGTRLTFEHTGFQGVGGFLLATLVMGPGHRKKLTHALPAVLSDLDETGRLRPDSSREPRF
jgi:uncharacterized protein YndB with AHSA1/START domain